MTIDAEVCVVGGGPAGATVAARLAQLGHDVAIVEQHPFPRPHIGESLSPAVWPILDLVGIRDSVESAGFTRTATARVRWRDEHAERVRAPEGLTVDRGRFDAILLARARDAGARVLEPGHACRPVLRGGGWELAVGGDTVRARCLVDATGRRRALGGRCTTTGPRTLALHATWRGGPPPDGTQTRVEAIAEGWLWGAHLPDGTFRAMALVDPMALVADGRDKERLYHRLLATSELFAALATDGAHAGPVHACDATTYAVATAIDETAVRVGEAAFAIDPLSSSGVQVAIQTGSAAASVVHSVLARGGDTAAAMEYYADLVRHAAERHAATAASLYAEHRRHAHEPFWVRRAAGAAPVQPPGAPAHGLAELLALRVRLPDDASLRRTPALVGDGVEWRLALAHPALDRPVAFLGGSELAPLIDVLHRSPTLAEAIRRWDAVLPRGRATAIAGWLHARGLLVAERVAV